MEETVAENLVEKGPGRRFGDLADIMAGGGQRLDIINADSLGQISKGPIADRRVKLLDGFQNTDFFF